MIGVIAPGRRDGKTSADQLIKYIANPSKLTDGEEELIGVWYNNISCDDPVTAVAEFQDLAATNRRVNHNLMHMVVSWPAGEYPSLDNANEAAKKIISDMGLADNQAVYALHKNTENYHLHIAVNRIGFDCKPVDPAGGWTKNAIQKSCRELEIGQGWKTQHGGSVDVIGGEVVYTGHRATVNKKARDFEIYTGEESQERKLKSCCGPILKNAKSWGEAHKNLAKYGVKISPKGSGGILIIDEIEVKLSRIDRAVTWGKLLKKLGEYQVAKTEYKTQNLEKVKPILKLPSWEQYSEERGRFYEDKKIYNESKLRAKNTLHTKHQEEFRSFIAKQKEERAALNRISMSGAEKNKARKLLSFKQAQERERHRVRIVEEKAAFKVRWAKTGKGKFPPFKTWLEEFGRPGEADIWRLRRQQGMIVPVEVSEDTPPPAAMSGILNFSAAVADNLAVYYEYAESYRSNVEDGGGFTAFADFGRRIDVFKETEDSILASLQLGLAKWGKIEVDGDADFREKCYQVAMKHGIKLNNAEFKERLELMKEHGYETQKEALATKQALEAAQSGPAEGILDGFNRYHSAVGAERYRVTVVKMLPGGEKKTMILDKKDGETRGFTPAELRGRIPELQRLAGRNENIYYTPLSDKTHHILVDDLNRERMGKLVEAGYKACALIESSPENYQAIINVPKMGSKFDKDVANRLTERLNRQFGDQNLFGAIHPHRAPGTPNCKPKYQRSDGSFPIVRLVKSEQRICPKAFARSEEIQQEYLRQAADEGKRRQAQEEHRRALGPSSVSPYAAYEAHVDNIRSHFANQDNSRVDAMAALRMRVTGFTQGEIEMAIAARAPDSRPESEQRKHGQWEVYARKTAAYAFSPAGDIEASKWGHYTNHWLKIEGRGTMDKQEQQQTHKHKIRQ